MARELIVITKPTDSGSPPDITDLNNVLANRGASIRPLYTAPIAPDGDGAAAPPAEPTPPPAAPPTIDGASLGMQPEPDNIQPLQNFYVVDADDSVLDTLLTELVGLESVAAAYVKPEAEPAVMPMLDGMTIWDLIRNLPVPPATPDFTANQLYKGVAPDGVDAAYAATLAGGKGAGVKIIDIEGGWTLTHEDLQTNKGGLLAGAMLGSTAADQLHWRNHGTAVLGVLGADDNGIGCTGICPDAWIAVMSHSGGSAAAIINAANQLRAGDILLLEMHRPGPAAGFANNATQSGYIAVEWWPDDLAAIRYAVGRGVIVVEAAGNGNQNLDDPMYDTRPSSFPADWANPFNAANVGSGAVVVGAGAPPPGTHGRDNGPARSRTWFSNYGSRVDCQGWGFEVTSTGYGDLQGGTSTPEDRWYTDRFNGTSSASPIVAGVIAAVNGFLLARNTTTALTPRLARMWLRATGSAQQDDPARPATQRIGNLPDLRYILTNI